MIIKTYPGETFSQSVLEECDQRISRCGEIKSSLFTPFTDRGLSEKQVFLVRPFVEGQRLDEVLQGGPLTVFSAITYGRLLLEAIEQLHQMGLLHNQISPKNVYIQNNKALNLIDAGMPVLLKEDQPVPSSMLADAHFISPEQAGLIQNNLRPSSDLYSWGVLFFNCLTGSLPFRSSNISDLLRSHLTSKPPDLSDINCELPASLNKIIQKCLKKDPLDRYQTAHAIQEDLKMVEEHIEKHISDSQFVPGLYDIRPTLADPALISRGEDVFRLKDLLKGLRQGKDGLVFIEAESGLGKSTLVQEVKQQADRLGIRTLLGEASTQEAKAPFQDLTNLFKNLIQEMKTDTSLRDRVQSEFEKDRETLCSALPEFYWIFKDESDIPSGPDHFREARILRAICRLFNTLASEKKPLLVVVDDGQWADEMMFKLIPEWVRYKETLTETNPYVLFLIAFRSEEVPAGHLIRMLQPTSHLVLKPFNSLEVRNMAGSMAGVLPAEALTMIEQLSQGVPFMVSDTLRGLVECKALVASENGWRVDVKAMSEIKSSRKATSLFSRRIDMLPPDPRRLLNVGAVIGKRFDARKAALLANLPLDRLSTCVEEAEKRQFVLVEREQMICLFIHDKIRETLLEKLDREEKKRIHRAFAQGSENSTGEKNFELAYHYDAAGLSDKAFPYAFEAAQTAMRRHALESAEQQFRICQRGVDPNDQSTQFGILKGLGYVLILQGKYDEALVDLKEAMAVATSDQDRADIQSKIGEVLFKKGDVQAAILETEKASRVLHINIPTTLVGFIGHFIFQLATQALHVVFPKLFVGRKKSTETGTDLMKVKLFGRLTYCYWFGNGVIPCLWAHFSGLNLAERYAPTPELGQVYSERVAIMALMGLYWNRFSKTADDFAARSLAIREMFNDTWGRAQTLSFFCVNLYFTARYEDAIVWGREAVKLLEQTGDYWEMNIARYQVAASLMRLGRFEEAVHEAWIIHRTGLNIGDIMASGISLDILVRATQGHISADIVRREVSRRRQDIQPQVQVMMAEGMRSFYAGEYKASSRVFKDALIKLKKNAFWNGYVSAALPWYMSSLRLDMEQQKNTELKELQLRKLKNVGRWARLMVHFTVVDKPHLYRELGLLSVHLNEEAKAKHYFSESLQYANEQKAQYEQVLSHIEHGTAGLRFGWRHAQMELDAAKKKKLVLKKSIGPISSDKISTNIDKEITLSLIDRFDNIVEHGRNIAKALSVEMVFQAFSHAASSLLRSQECFLFMKNENGELEPFDPTQSIEAPLMEWAKLTMQCNQTLILSTPDGAFPPPANEKIKIIDLAIPGVRSALGAAFQVRGRPVGCFVVTHREISNLFGPEEIRLSDYLLTLVGAALENAEGFAQLQNMNQMLEARVEERTRELKTVNAHLEQLTYIDPLTKLLNRRGLENIMLHEMQTSTRKTLDILVLLIDLDNFKGINDNLGYATGDIALKETGRRIQESSREGDFAARIGGDEFIILLKETRVAEGLRIAERLCANIQKTVVSGPAGSFSLSASLGLVRSTTSSPRLDDLLAQAHIALHRSKLNGKAQVTFGEWDKASDGAQKENKFYALEQFRQGKNLYCVQMPIIQLPIGKAIGYEMLIRSTMPGHEMPDEIFGLCRESDVLVTIDYECFKACAQEALKVGEGQCSFMNVFPSTVVQLPPEKFLEPFHGSITPGSICLEISEQQIIGDSSRLSEAAEKLKKLGFLIAMDDVGFGRSNLETFIALEPDVIKIDKRFVQGIHHDKNLQMFMKRMLNVIRNTPARIIAEGIETTDELKVLESMGITLGQGYLWGKPQNLIQSSIRPKAA
ncbi:MAG: Serine/threonine-protein kinase PknD [Elusimicrobia bacterium]|nr:Serine/threonine-protein kinase PknD [Elusimicrobiota bacterium]